MAEETKTPTISPEIKSKYQLKKGFAAGIYRFNGNDVDLTTCSLKEADALVESGFDVIEEITPAKIEKTTSDTKK
jgi:hypothetical protein